MLGPKPGMVSPDQTRPDQSKHVNQTRPADKTVSKQTGRQNGKQANKTRTKTAYNKAGKQASRRAKPEPEAKLV